MFWLLITLLSAIFCGHAAYNGFLSKRYLDGWFFVALTVFNAIFFLMSVL